MTTRKVENKADTKNEGNRIDGKKCSHTFLYNFQSTEDKNANKTDIFAVIQWTMWEQLKSRKR